MNGIHGSAGGRSGIVATILAVALTTAATAGEWTSIRGPQRDGISTETGLLDVWPEAGPEKLWTLEGVGGGYSSVSISADGFMYTMGDLGDDQMAFGISLADRKIVWKTKIGPAHHDMYNGPRCVPTIDGDNVYVVGTSSDVACLNRKTGDIVWALNMEKDFGGRMMSVWKFSESPLVDGELCVFTPGVEKAMIVAVDKKTGKTVWKCDTTGVDFSGNGKDGAGYSSIMVGELDGVRQYVQFVGRGLIGVDITTGKLLWHDVTVANGTANISFPIFVDGTRIFWSSAYRGGSAMTEVTKNGEEFTPKTLWTLGEREYANHHGGTILLDGTLYGGSGGNRGVPTAVDAKTGKVLWSEPQPGGGSSAWLYADGKFYIRYQDHVMILAKATPEGFEIVSRFTSTATEKESWAYPVIVDGKMYLRTQDVIECYRVK